MKKIKEMAIIFISYGIGVFVIKLIFNKFNYSSDILIDSLLMSLGFVIGWFGYKFLCKKFGKKNKC